MYEGDPDHAHGVSYMVCMCVVGYVALACPSPVSDTEPEPSLLRKRA